MARSNSADPLNPLSDADLEAMNAVLAIAAKRREFLQKLDRCGIKVDELVNMNDTQCSFCENCKREFFPGAK